MQIQFRQNIASHTVGLQRCAILYIKILRELLKFIIKVYFMQYILHGKVFIFETSCFVEVIYNVRKQPRQKRKTYLRKTKIVSSPKYVSARIVKYSNIQIFKKQLCR